MRIFKRNWRYILPVVAVMFVIGGNFFATEAATVFPAFSSRTIDGEVVSDALFAEQKLTMINLWGTFCPPCIAEMPDLGQLGRSMPEGTRLIGIVLDVGDDETLNDARRIRDETNADFLHILPVADMAPYLRTIVAVPTTIFVDSQGRITGEPLVGSRSESDYRAALVGILKDL
jgi:thiol-disulfide isomerase/thioredoxin